MGNMKKLFILGILAIWMPVLFVGISCSGSGDATGFHFTAGEDTHTWTKGEVGVFGEGAIAVQTEEDGVFRLSFIASRELLRSGPNASANVIAISIKDEKKPTWTKGKKTGLLLLDLDGKRHTGAVDITIAEFGKVGGLVSGRFSGIAGELRVEGAFSVRRVKDALE